MSHKFYLQLAEELRNSAASGLQKTERDIATRQGATIGTIDGTEVTNLCANNYLGLSSHPRFVAAASDALRTNGYGLGSVRFICGTQDLLKALAARLSRFPGTEETLSRTTSEVGVLT